MVLKRLVFIALLLFIAVVQVSTRTTTEIHYAVEKTSETFFIAANRTILVYIQHPSNRTVEVLRNQYQCMFLQNVQSKNVTFSSAAAIKSLSGNRLGIECAVPFLIKDEFKRTMPILLSVFSIVDQIEAANLASNYSPILIEAYLDSEVISHSNSSEPELMPSFFSFQSPPQVNMVQNGKRMISGGSLVYSDNSIVSLYRKQVWLAFQFTLNTSSIAISYTSKGNILYQNRISASTKSLALDQTIIWSLYLNDGWLLQSNFSQQSSNVTSYFNNEAIDSLVDPFVGMTIELGDNILVEAISISCPSGYFNSIDNGKFLYCSIVSCQIDESGNCAKSIISKNIKEALSILTSLVPWLHLLPLVFAIILFVRFVIHKIMQCCRVRKNYEMEIAELKNLSITFEKVSAFHQRKTILSNVNGFFVGGKMNLIMGPSGSGKSTLLNIICGGFTGQYKGTIRLNSTKFDYEKLKDMIGVVPQKDIVTPSFTVYLNLFFSALLRLFTLNPKKVDEKVKSVASKLNLNEVINSRAGDEHKRGISGGQLKRLNIGLELISDPKILLLDEPTSGLDGYVALEIMKSIKQLVDTENITVIAVLHQPRKEILNLFDHLVLFGKNKKIAYCGPTANAESDMFSRIATKGQRPFWYENPADRIISFVDLNLREQSVQMPQIESNSKVIPQRIGKVFDFAIHYLVCVARNFISTALDFSSLFVNLFLVVLAALIIGLLFLHNQFSGAPSLPRYRSCQDSLIPLCEGLFADNLMSSLSGATLVLSLCGSLAGTSFLRKEMDMIRRESQRGLSLFIYFLAKDTVFIFVVLALSLVFSIIVYTMTNLTSVFLGIWLLFFLIYYTASGLGIICSIVIPNESLMQLAAAVLVFLAFIFGGSTIGLSELENSVPPIPFVSTFSFIRYYLESLYLSEALPYQTTYNISKNLKIFDYSLDNRWYFLLGICFAVGYRALAICLLYVSTKAEKVKGYGMSLLCTACRK